MSRTASLSVALGALLLALAPSHRSQAGSSPSASMLTNASNAILPAARVNLGSRPVLNAKTDYGAKGDGTTNDGPALASALAACDATHPLYLPPGTYKTQQALTMSPNCHLYGDNTRRYYTGSNPPGTVIQADNTNGAFTPNPSYVLRTVGSDDEIDGVAVLGVANATSIFFTDGILRQVLAGGGYRGVECAGGGGGQAQIFNSEMARNSNIGFYAYCPDLIFMGNDAHDNGTQGVYAAGQVHAQYVYNTFEWNVTAGMQVDGTFNVDHNILINGNKFDRNSGPGLKVTGGANTVDALAVIGNEFRRDGASGAGGVQIAFTGAMTDYQEYGNTFSSAAINDDGSGIVAPDYIYSAAAGTTFANSKIREGAPAQNVGMYKDATTKAALVGIVGDGALSTSELDKTSDTALAVVPGLSLPLNAGQSYRCAGHVTGTAGASGGAQIALVASGGLTATSASFSARNFNGATLNAQSTATTLGSAIGAATAVFTDIYWAGAIVVNAAGTLNLEFAQNASNATTSKAFVNSTMECSRVN